MCVLCATKSTGTTWPAIRAALTKTILLREQRLAWLARNVMYLCVVMPRTLVLLTTKQKCTIDSKSRFHLYILVQVIEQLETY